MTTPKPAPSDTADIIVVGGGGSGLATALSAAQQGASVIILEKGPQCGGTTAMAVGSYTAAGTNMQKRAAVEDKADDHIEDVPGFAPPSIEARNNHDLRAHFLRHAGEAWNWLEALGLIFQGPMPEPPNRVPRMHNVVPKAHVYISTFLQHLAQTDAKIMTSCPADELLTDKGRVVGVRSGNRQFHARKGVVLAAGDYAASNELLKSHKGQAYGGMKFVNPLATGDGHKLAQEAGGELVNMDVTYGPELRFPPAPDGFLDRIRLPRMFNRLTSACINCLPKAMIQAIAKRRVVAWQHPENSLFDDGAVMLNKHGERFCDETQADLREQAMVQQADAAGWILLDSRLQQQYSAWPSFISTAPRIAYAYVNDYRKLRPDLCTFAKDLPSLASATGMDLDKLQHSVSERNASMDQEQADAFGRTSAQHELQGPWLLLGPAYPYITITEGGAAINSSNQVLDADKEAIPGLYAVGQNGLGGQILFGHGLHIAWAITSGYLVGKTLAAQTDNPPTEKSKSNSNKLPKQAHTL